MESVDILHSPPLIPTFRHLTIIIKGVFRNCKGCLKFSNKFFQGILWIFPYFPYPSRIIHRILENWIPLPLFSRFPLWFSLNRSFPPSSARNSFSAGYISAGDSFQAEFKKGNVAKQSALQHSLNCKRPRLGERFPLQACCGDTFVQTRR